MNFCSYYILSLNYGVKYLKNWFYKEVKLLATLCLCKDLIIYFRNVNYCISIKPFLRGYS